MKDNQYKTIRFALVAVALLLSAIACKRAPTRAEAPTPPSTQAAATLPGAVTAPTAATVAVAEPVAPPLVNFELPRRAIGDDAAVATAHPLATRVAAQAIYQGGTAVDALVAASFMLTVVTPHSTGIGGGGFALVWPGATQPATAWDFRETAPAGGKIADYLDANGRAVAGRSRNHGLAVGVPGYVAGLETLHRKYGKRPWAKLVLPAAEAAERGFAVGKGTAWAIAAVWKQLGEAERSILGNQGKPLKQGDILRHPALAKTLRKIAKDGSAGFYGGAVGAEIVSVVRARGGKLTTMDMTTYKVRQVAPMRGRFFGRDVLTMPQPSAGGAQFLAMAEFTEAFLRKLPKAERKAGDGAGALHALAEAMRRSFVLRFAYSGDTDKPAAGLGSVYPKRKRKRLARSFKVGKASKSASLILRGSTTGQGSGSHTSHVSIIDRQGMAVSSTHTVNLLFGAAIIAPVSGVWLNNELDDFAFNLKDSNAFGLAGNRAGLFRPGARPTSSMTPTIILEKGKPRLLLGAPGGTRIPTAVFLTAFWHLQSGMPLQEASDHFRIHHQALADELWLEEGDTADFALAGLSARGHTVVRRVPWCNVQAIAVQPDGDAKARYEAVSDKRGDGGAMCL